ncbi:MAG: hypothetical protein GMKNLPBB_00308 [Myxococcota bacterium]|nr:hypothetical protein [Myxococcota bacterium]
MTRHLLLAVFLMMPAGAAAQNAASPAPAVEEVIEEIEEIEEVDPKAGGAASSAGKAPPAVAQEGGAASPAESAPAKKDPKAMDLKTLLGHLHPAVVHLPIGWLNVLLILELLALLLKRRELEPAGLWVHGVLLAGFPPAIMSGIMREEEMEHLGSLDKMAETHERLMFIVAGLCVASFILRFVKRREFTGAPRIVYLVILLAAAGVMAYSGHIGGEMVYGEDHLPF